MQFAKPCLLDTEKQAKGWHQCMAIVFDHDLDARTLVKGISGKASKPLILYIETSSLYVINIC